MRRLQLCTAALGLILASSTAAANVLPTKPRIEHLKNGLTVVMVHWDSPGIVAYYSLVRTGSRDEVEKGHTGFAHLFEHLMFRGTKRYPQAAYEAKIQEFGANNNAFTGDNQTCYTVLIPKDVLPQIIEIDADRFQNLKFSEAVFKTETGAVLGEYGMSSSNPRLMMGEKLRETAFKKHTYGHTTIGYLADVKAMPGYYKYAERFHRWYYTPDNTTLIVVGDFDEEATFKKIEQEYVNWKGKRRDNHVPEEPEQTEARSVHVPWKGPTASKMTIAYKIPAFDPQKNSAALAVLSELVFGESSPLYRKLIVEDQKLLDLRAPRGLYGLTARDPSLFEIGATLAPGTTFDEIQNAITRAIAEVAAGGITAERLDAVKSNTKYGFILGLETPSDIALTLVSLISATGDPLNVDVYGQALADVTADDVIRVAKEYLSETRRTVVTLATEEGGPK